MCQCTCNQTPWQYNITVAINFYDSRWETYRTFSDTIIIYAYNLDQVYELVLQNLSDLEYSPIGLNDPDRYHWVKEWTCKPIRFPHISRPFFED